MDFPVILKWFLAPTSGAWLPPEDWVEEAFNDEGSFFIIKVDGLWQGHKVVNKLRNFSWSKCAVYAFTHQAAAPLVHPHHKLHRERDGVLHHRGLSPQLRRACRGRFKSIDPIDGF